MIWHLFRILTHLDSAAITTFSASNVYFGVLVPPFSFKQNMFILYYLGTLLRSREDLIHTNLRCYRPIRFMAVTYCRTGTVPRKSYRFLGFKTAPRRNIFAILVWRHGNLPMRSTDRPFLSPAVWRETSRCLGGRVQEMIVTFRLVAVTAKCEVVIVLVFFSSKTQNGKKPVCDILNVGPSAFWGIEPPPSYPTPGKFSKSNPRYMENWRRHGSTNIPIDRETVLYII